jgi:hypothetical protein
LVTERIVPPGGYETIEYAQTLGVTAGEVSKTVSKTKPALNPERFNCRTSQLEESDFAI